MTYKFSPAALESICRELQDMSLKDSEKLARIFHDLWVS